MRQKGTVTLILSLGLLGTVPGFAQKEAPSAPVRHMTIDSWEFVALYTRYAQQLQTQGARGLQQLATPDFKLRWEGETLSGAPAWTEIGKYADNQQNSEVTVRVRRMRITAASAVFVTEESIRTALEPSKAGATTWMTMTWGWKQTWQRTPDGWKLAVTERYWDDKPDTKKPKGVVLSVTAKAPGTTDRR
jgi:hypothetical protein